MLQFLEASKNSIPQIVTFMERFNRIDGYPFIKKITKKNIKHFLKNSNLGKIWMIEKDEVAIGYLVLTFCFSFEYKGLYAYIDEIYIEETYRNQGIGTKAMEFAMRQAKKLKIKMIYLEVEKNNKKAKNIYTKLGFTENKRLLMMRKP